MNELTKRVLFALTAAPIFIAVISVGGIYFWSLMLLIGLFTTWEIARLASTATYPTNTWFAFLFLISWFSTHYHDYGFLILGLVILIVVVKETLTPPHSRFLSILTTAFAGLYPAWGFFSLFELRTIFGTNEQGLFLVLLVMLMIWGNDSFAYFGGKNFGKHKMAPEISPAKTWEGFISGFAGALLVFVCMMYFLADKFAWHWQLLLPIAFIVSVFGPIGDLLESKIKRFAGMKDSSNLLPGHGGFFDRFDSVILVSPAVVVYLFLISK